MDYELHQKLKKGKLSAITALCEAEAPTFWFICCHIAGNTAQAAELLVRSWASFFRRISNSDDCLQHSFSNCLSKEIFIASSSLPPADDMFAGVPAPQISPSFQVFVEAVDRMECVERTVYLLTTFGDLQTTDVSKLLKLPRSEAKMYLGNISLKASPQFEDGYAESQRIKLSTQFKSSDKKIFEKISVPPMLLNTLEHESMRALGKGGNKTHSNQKRKDLETIKPTANSTGRSTQPNRRVAAKKKKTIIISCVAAALAIALIITLIAVIKKANTPAPTITTTYKIEEVTLGNVSTTISASGSLTPIQSDTFTAAELLDELEEGSDETEGAASAQAESDAEAGIGAGSGTITMPEIPEIIVGGTIDSVNVQVGDTVAEGDVIAVIVFENEETRNILAPYDAVILEWYLSEGVEVSDETSVAMFMGTDGYKMTISVDENNISLVELGQDVEISNDASNEEMPTGKVTDISYNGSASGSTTAYNLTVTFDYVEGTYPGMSVSAEVIIEDSGEGLLVPVSAVQTSGDTKYVYLAPSGAKLADVYEDGDIDVSKLTKVNVTTGMSDGSYVMIESGDLSEGDLVVVITRTSTLTGTEDSDANGRGEMGDFGGFPDGMGGFPGGDFDFGDFDPSQMPSGGFPFGG